MPPAPTTPLCGTIAAFDLTVERPGYLHPAGLRLQRHALEARGFLRPLGHVVYLLPPLCLSDSQLRHCYAVIRSALDQLN